VDWALVRRLSGGVVLGVVLGTWIAASVSGAVLRGCFAVLALLVAVKMLLGSKTTEVAQEKPMSSGLAFGFGGIIGSLSVMVGIGGGSLTVPILRSFHIQMQKAVACAAAIGFVIALPGAVGFILTGWGQAGLPAGSFGYVNLMAFVVIVPLTMSFAPVGAALAHRLEGFKLQRIFALFLLVMGIEMIWDLV